MQDTSTQNRTLDLASSLEVGPAGSKASGDYLSRCGSAKSVMTIAFQFAFEIHLQENVAAMARQYVRSIISSVQRVALALSPSRFGSQVGLRPPPGTPEAQTLARWICQSYRCAAWTHNCYSLRQLCLFVFVYVYVNLYIHIYTEFFFVRNILNVPPGEGGVVKYWKGRKGGFCFSKYKNEGWFYVEKKHCPYSEIEK